MRYVWRDVGILPERCLGVRWTGGEGARDESDTDSGAGEGAG